MAENGKKRTLRVDEVAKVLSCSDSLVYDLARDGELTAFRVGRGAKRGGLRILAESVEAFIARGCAAYQRECLGLDEIASTFPADPAEILPRSKTRDR